MSSSVAQMTRDWALSKKISLKFSNQVSSTNSWSKDDDSLVSLYLTENQTAGRGRNQNQWIASNPAGQLFSSWVFQLAHAPQPLLSPLVGLALYKALAGVFGEYFALKAPNDIYMQDKKIAGILIENIQVGSQYRLIIGIGLNVFSKPSLPSAGRLLDKIPDTVIVGNWPPFLDQFSKELSSVALAQIQKLNPEQQQNLLSALNQFSLLEEKYEAVMEDGSLQLKSKLIHWSAL